MALVDPERRNIPNRSVILPNSVVFRTDYVRVVVDTSILSAAECRRKNLVFNDISFMTILAGDHPSESVKVSHCSGRSPRP